MNEVNVSEDQELVPAVRDPSTSLEFVVQAEPRDEEEVVQDFH
jgi:hypothetical protein